VARNHTGPVLSHLTGLASRVKGYPR
jgi:hypothetical protein